MITFTLLLAFILRILVINQSLWLDEAIGAIAVKDFSYQGIIFDFLKSDNHPPLYYLSLKAWTSIFGFSDVAIRLLSLVFGVFTVYLTFKIAKAVTYGKNTAFANLATLLLATSPIHIYYSQEARMYAMAAFFAALSFYAFIKSLEKAELKYFLIFSFSLPLLLFTDYVPFFLIPAFWLIGLLAKKGKTWWKYFILSHIPLFVLYFFWAPFFLFQVQKGRWLLATLPAWKKVAGGANIREAALVWAKFTLGRISLVNKKLYFALVSLGSVPFIFAFANALRAKVKQVSLWIWLVLPLILGFIFSVSFPAFVYFRFIFVLPAFYLLVAWGVLAIKSGKLRVFTGIGLILVNILGFSIYVLDKTQHREDWRAAVSFVEEEAKENEIVIFGFPEPFAPYNWYQKDKVESLGVTNSISPDEETTKINTKETVSAKDGVYYFEYLKELSDPQGAVESALGESGFELISIKDFRGVGFVKYYLKRI